MGSKKKKLIHISQSRMPATEKTREPVGNPYASLYLSYTDSDSEEDDLDKKDEVNVSSNDTTVPNRQWEIQSPVEPSKLFSRGKKRANTKRQNEDGWTSIAWSRPRFIGDDDEERKIKEEILEEAIMPTTPTYTAQEEDKTKFTQLAKEWSAKIRAGLEKAEASTVTNVRRTELSEDFIASLGKLSFFRKPMTVSN